MIACLVLDAETATSLLRDPAVVTQAAALVRERAPWVTRDVRDEIIAAVTEATIQDKVLIQVNLGPRPPVDDVGQ